jgi:hypothetical protein
VLAFLGSLSIHAARSAARARTGSVTPFVAFFVSFVIFVIFVLAAKPLVAVLAANDAHARIFFTTSPCTSVRRKSRPWNR